MSELNENSFKELVENNTFIENKVAERIANIATLVYRLEHQCGGAISGFDGDISIPPNYCGYELVGDTLRVSWCCQEPWEDWQYDSHLEIPLGLLDKSDGDVWEHYKQAVKGEERRTSRDEIANVMLKLDFLKSRGVDVVGLASVVANNDCWLATKRQELAEEFLDKVEVL